MKPYWPDKSVYFLTGVTFLHYPYFCKFEQKQILLNQIKKIQINLKIPISAFSIALNHYHIKFYLESGLDLAKIKQVLHGGTSFEYRKLFKPKYREFWQNCKTIKIVNDDMDWKITGYIIGNLLKHKEVNNFEELKRNPFSSYRYIAESYGDEVAKNLVCSVIDINETANGELDFKGLKAIKIAKPSAKAG